MDNYTDDGLNLVTSLAPQISNASQFYGISPLAIAGAIAQEKLNQSNNPDRAYWSAIGANAYLDARLTLARAQALASDPLNPSRALSRVPRIASDNILSSYGNLDSTDTVGRDFFNKAMHPLLLDYGPAGVKYTHAIQAVLADPQAPGLAPYANNLWTLGVNLQNGSDQQLTATSVGQYVRQGQQIIASLMGGEEAWNSLSPTMQNALAVQYYNQGPDRNIKAAQAAYNNGGAYEPHIGSDGAGANYVANEAVLIAALTGPAFWVDQSKIASQPAYQVFPSYTLDRIPGPNPFNPGDQLYTSPDSAGVSNAFISPAGYGNRNALGF